MKPVRNASARIVSLQESLDNNLIAGFHSAMSTALPFLDNLVSQPEGKLLAMRHASHTFRLVKQKIYGQSAVTDLTIAAIVSMAQYEHHQNQFQQGSVHLQGLWQIAQLRGGISDLIRSPYGLGQKLLRYSQALTIRVYIIRAYTYVSLGSILSIHCN
jgi:hypothetical protein